jgi:hypothetical protein
MYIEVILLDVILKKEFRLYLAKACFTIAVNKRDSLEYLYYFSLGLQEHNKYLKRRLSYEIKDIDKIFSKVSLLDYDARIGIVRSLSNSFEPEADRLKSLKYLSLELMSMVPVSTMPEGIGILLTQQTLKSELKIVGTILAASIPIMVSIIALVFKK